MSAAEDLCDVGSRLQQELLSAVVNGIDGPELSALVNGVVMPAVTRWLAEGVTLGYIAAPPTDGGRWQLAIVAPKAKLTSVASPTQNSIAERLDALAERIVQVLAEAGEPLSTAEIRGQINVSRRPLVNFALESLRQAGRARHGGDGRWRLTD
jgi:hypothetical protein